MHDLSQDFWLRKRDLQDRLVEIIGSYGYRFLETPILESTELFLRKSGGELASKLYSFTDAGGNQVSLRPEFTAPIMRHYLEHGSAIDLPMRWQYAGPVFRYDEENGNRQFTQVGAELLGSANVTADAEILGLALAIPERLGLVNCWLELGDLGVLHSVLDAVGVSERARAFIIDSVPRLQKGRDVLPSVLEQAQQLHLVVYGGEDNYLSAAIQGLDDTEARKVLRGLLQWAGAEQLGQRNPNEVVERLLRKLRGSDDLSELQWGLELVARLVAIRGEPSAAIVAAGAIVHQAGADLAALDRLSELLDLLRQRGTVLLDFGLARGLAYYNGVVFEVKHPAWRGSLGGGGRYDGLARALGSLDTVPALGFAYTLETLLELTEAR
jgi:histidyl-tRNA synthetase